MIIPSRRALMREMIALEREGVPMRRALQLVFKRYGLHRFPPNNTPVLLEHRADLLLRIRYNRWPMTKAGYVRAMFSPYMPSFPLDADVMALVPGDLPGPMPTTGKELVFEQPTCVGLENIAALEKVIGLTSRAELEHRQRQCTLEGHAWTELRTSTFARGPELYCVRCLLLRLAGFEGWPTPPREDLS